MEKRRPTYDLEAFKTAFQEIGTAQPRMTGTALKGARELGLTVGQMVDAIQSMTRRHFFKSMTSYTDHTVWQDVYHLPYQGTVIYVKFVADVVTEFRLLSFKEK
jgi:motility quorum-sensing regulator / GCU-specific mRNA interferase toxin